MARKTSLFLGQLDMPRWLLVASCLAVLRFGVGPTHAQVPPQVPADNAILDLKIVKGDGARVFVDDVLRSSTRIRFTGFRPETLYKHVVKVVFPSGETVEREVHQRGGWSVTLPIVRDSTPRPELVIQAGHADAVTGLACSADGKYLATAGSGDRRVLLWDLETRREVRSYAGYEAWTWCVAFSPDSSRLAIGLADGSVSIRDVASGAIEGTIRPDPAQLTEVRAVAFDAAGKHLLIAGKGTTAYLWDLAAKEVRRTFAGDGKLDTAVAFHPEAAQVLVASRDGKARLYDMNTGKLLGTFKGHRGPIRSAVFSRDGASILTAADDGAAALWDAKRGTVRKLFEDKIADGERIRLRGAAFTSDPNVVVTAAVDGSLSAWSTATGLRLERFGAANKPGSQPEHTKSIECLVAAADGATVFTASADCQTIRWDVASRKPVAVFRSRVERPYALGFSGDGKRIIAGAGDDQLLMWDLQSAAMVKRLDGPGKLIRALDMSPDGRFFLTAADDGAVRLWSGTNGKAIGAPFQGHQEMATAVRFSARGNKAVSSCRARYEKEKLVASGEAIVWSIPSGKMLGTYGGHVGAVWDAALDPAGRILLTCGEDTKAILRELPSGKILHTLEGHTSMVVASDFTADGSKVVTASMDNTAILWDVKTGRKLREFAGQHHRGIATLRFLPGDKELLTVSFDGTICLWEVATAVKIRTFRGHTGPADVLALHPDGRHFVTGAGDGTIRLWDLATGEELAWWIAVDPPRSKSRRSLDWIVATPDGLFDASAGARDNVEVRIGKGLKVVKIDRFYRDFHREGLLTTLLSGKREMPPAALGARIAPEVRIVTQKLAGPVKQADFVLEAEVADNGSGIGAVRLRQSGSQFALVPNKEKRGSVWRYRFDVELTPGKNILEVQADGAETGSPESEPRRLEVRLEKPEVSGTLHVLAVGVSKVRDPGILKLRFAHLDAARIAKLCAERGKQMFEGVEVHSLTEEKATRAEILRELADMTRRAKTNDTVVVFFAGHGTLDADSHRFFLVPSDYDETDKVRSECLARSAISGKELIEKIVDMKALNRLVILDTCNSGAVQRDLRQIAAQSDAMTRNTGVFMLVAALEGKEAAESAAFGHGILTYTLLAAVGDAVKGKLENSPLRKEYATALDLVNYVSERIVEVMPDQEIPLITAAKNFKVMPVRQTK
jgi:WD40 repeat protein